MRRLLILAAACFALAAQEHRDLRVEPVPAEPRAATGGQRWAVVVGISTYSFLPPAAQLRFAHRDAEEFARFLRSAAGGGMQDDHVRLLVNEHATLAQVRAELEEWAAGAAGPGDIVYFFFAGHGVLDDAGDGYFVVHDSDPQNLHATALAFREVDAVLAGRLRAGLAVVIADACHAGRLGWSSYTPRDSGRASDALASVPQGDRSLLKLLASRPSEQSFEDDSWEGGHGIFTRVLLTGLNGAADADGDRLIRASEAIDYVSKYVPELTDSRQHPRVAGTFDARVPIAFRTPQPTAPPVPRLRSPLTELRRRLESGRVLESSGAWDFYRKESFDASERPAAAALMAGALEEIGQACVVDYVQSTSAGLKQAMFERAVAAYERLRVLRPNDRSLEGRQLFCRGRLLISQQRFAEAVPTLEASLRIDPRFACSYNALGVALGRINRPAEARRAFETAARLTPEWALPPFQIAAQLIAAGEPANAVPFLEKAIAFNPRSPGTRWSLMHVERILGRTGEAEKQAAALMRLDPNYAPTYYELGLVYEAAGNLAKAAEAYDAYLALAPNFADSLQVRARADRLRRLSGAGRK